MHLVHTGGRCSHPFHWINLATNMRWKMFILWTNKVALNGSIQVLTVASSINPLPGKNSVQCSGQYVKPVMADESGLDSANQPMLER